MEHTVSITTPFIKLEALLKYAGLVGTGGGSKIRTAPPSHRPAPRTTPPGCAAPGGESKIRIAEGEVLVNGEVCTQRGRKLHPGDRVELGGEALLVAEA